MISAENDGKTIVVGGIITGVRTILTKKNTKMAFVKIENKTSDTEIIVFPNTFEQYGDKLIQDNVVKITGRVNAKDKDGNIVSEVKVLAESVEVVSDNMLENYEATGMKLAAPITAAKPTYRRTKTSAEGVSKFVKTSQPEEPVRVPIAPPKDHRGERLYLLIEHPDDADTLTKVRKICDQNIGTEEVILVLKDGEEKTPLRMPFKVDIGSKDLIESLRSLLSKDNVKIK